MVCRHCQVAVSQTRRHGIGPCGTSGTTISDDEVAADPVKSNERSGDKAMARINPVSDS